MIRLADSTLRGLTSPAVHPPESTPPPALVSSLVAVAVSILDLASAGRHCFPCNKRNASSAVRCVSNLLLLLEELRPLAAWPAACALHLCLSELHPAFHRLRNLLEDLSRDGGRVWMLMQSPLVAGEFYCLMRAVATAMDVFPWDVAGGGVAAEVREVVDLTIRQVRKLRYGVEPSDRRVMNDVNAILSNFEAGIVPNRSSLREVLDYVGVHDWTSCDEEIRALECELATEHASIEKREIKLVSDLLGLMCYSRSVCFEATDRSQNLERGGQGEGRKVKLLQNVNPDDFQCPISLELMMDPVVTSSGHTYDRGSILKWFRAGNSTCPKTGETLSHKKLVPNVALKRLIEIYCAENNNPVSKSRKVDREAVQKVLTASLVAQNAVRLLAEYLVSQLERGTDPEQNKAAYEIRALAKRNTLNRSSLVEAGCIPHLLRMLSSKDSSMQENAIAALLNVSKHSAGKAIIVDNGGLAAVANILKNGLNLEGRQHAAATLFYLSSVEENQRLIGEIPETIEVLVKMATDGSDRGKKNALVAIFGLLPHQSNHRRVIAAGAIPLLKEQLKSCPREDIATDCLAVLSCLAGNREGANVVLRTGVLCIVAGILNSSTSRVGRELCVTLLLNICNNGGTEVVSHLAESTSLMTSLYSLLTEGTPRASKKASSLIRILQDYSEKRSHIQPLFLQERYVHAW
ncbi:hypothetical protein MLD38_008541 [Melastoma candidum]|uniref:Uncharacterized protein n=1 Tax=Melastoma candidum TaxID=119954 RepID=A0ACB9RXQ3_9MYRT|nr:hypothetical protein MLD38_008541 [Melastoma candidum]